MSNIISKTYALIQVCMTWYQLDGRHVVRRRRRSSSLGAAPAIHAASHFYHEKTVAWVSISMHACDPVPMVMGLRLAALWATGAPLKKSRGKNLIIVPL